jgi:hypothetical protein
VTLIADLKLVDYVPPLTARSGAGQLLWAVLIDGLETYCRHVLHGGTDHLEFREAETWIFSLDSRAPNSFNSLCDLFEIDTTRLRRTLARLRENPGEVGKGSRGNGRAGSP